MSAHIYNSNPLAQRMLTLLREEAIRFRQRHDRAATLAHILVGHDDAAEVYSKQLTRSCREVGVEDVRLAHPFETTEQELRDEVVRLSNDTAIDGVVILLPLPDHIRQRMVTDVLPPAKDVDGLGPRNAGNLLLGFPNFIPSTADVVLNVLADAQIPLAGRHAVVIGRSNVGGKPIALQLIRRDATVTICHSHTRDLADITRSADILVVSVGRPGFLTGEMVKPGAAVLDAGINTVNGRVVGDVDAATVAEKASFLTPVPGGLGPLTHLTLIRHTLVGPR